MSTAARQIESGKRALFDFAHLIVEVLVISLISSACRILHGVYVVLVTVHLLHAVSEVKLQLVVDAGLVIVVKQGADKGDTSSVMGQRVVFQEQKDKQQEKATYRMPS